MLSLLVIGPILVFFLTSKDRRPVGDNYKNVLTLFGVSLLFLLTFFVGKETVSFSTFFNIGQNLQTEINFEAGKETFFLASFFLFYFNIYNIEQRKSFLQYLIFLLIIMSKTFFGFFSLLFLSLRLIKLKDKNKINVFLIFLIACSALLAVLYQVTYFENAQFLNDYSINFFFFSFVLLISFWINLSVFEFLTISIILIKLNALPQSDLEINFLNFYMAIILLKTFFLFKEKPYSNLKLKIFESFWIIFTVNFIYSKSLVSYFVSHLCLSLIYLSLDWYESYEVKNKKELMKKNVVQVDMSFPYLNVVLVFCIVYLIAYTFCSDGYSPFFYSQISIAIGLVSTFLILVFKLFSLSMKEVDFNKYDRSSIMNFISILLSFIVLNVYFFKNTQTFKLDDFFVTFFSLGIMSYLMLFLKNKNMKLVFLSRRSFFELSNRSPKIRTNFISIKIKSWNFEKIVAALYFFLKLDEKRSEFAVFSLMSVFLIFIILFIMRGTV